MYSIVRDHIVDCVKVSVVTFGLGLVLAKYVGPYLLLPHGSDCQRVPSVHRDIQVLVVIRSMTALMFPGHLDFLHAWTDVDRTLNLSLPRIHRTVISQVRLFSARQSSHSRGLESLHSFAQRWHSLVASGNPQIALHGKAKVFIGMQNFEGHSIDLADRERKLAGYHEIILSRGSCRLIELYTQFISHALRLSTKFARLKNSK